MVVGNLQDKFYSVNVGAIEACAFVELRLPDWSPEILAGKLLPHPSCYCIKCDHSTCHTMQPKELSTVRVSNVSPGLHKRELEHFFESHGLRKIRNISLCPSSAREDAPLVATVTFKSPSDARRALDSERENPGRAESQC